MPRSVLIGLAMLAAGSGHAEDSAGWVMALQGRWTVQGAAAPLAVGMPVPAGAQLLLAPRARGDHITIVAAGSGALLLARQCDQAPGCAAPLRVPRPAPAADGPLAPWLGRIARRLAGEPDRYVATLSRGGPAAADAVLEWRDGQSDLAPLLAGLPAGADYELRLSPLRCAAPCASTWAARRRGGAAEPLPAPAAVPGLYELSLGRAAPADHTSTVAPPRPRRRLWLLLLPAPAHAEAAAQYGRAVALAEAWGPEVDPALKLGFTRALLDVLAER